MDNKQDRQFYWEVKQFLQNSNNVSVEKMAPKPSMVDAIKSIVETSKPPAPKAIDNSIVGGIGQVIQSTESSKAGYKAQSQAYTTNNISNPFYLSEGYWDNLMQGLAALGDNPRDYKQTILTPEQSREKARLAKLTSSQSLTGDQLNLERMASGNPLTSGELLTKIAAQKTTPGVPLTPEQKRERDLAGELKREEGLEQIAQADVEAEEAGSKIVRTPGREYGLKPETLDAEASPSNLGSDATTSLATMGSDVSDKAKGLLASMNAKKTTTATPPTAPIKSSPGGLATYGSVQRTPEQIAADKAKATANKKAQLEKSLSYFETLHSQKQGSGTPEQNARRVAHMTKLQQQLEALG
jgi:hypothetical protein